MPDVTKSAVLSKPVKTLVVEPAQVLAEVPRPGKGWWTLGIAAVIGALGAVQTSIGQVIPENLVGPILIGISIVISTLRMFTGTPVGAKSLDQEPSE